MPSSLADGGSSYIVDPSGDLSPTNMIVDDFNLSIVALQLHYRYEIAPLSNIYLVYSRGGTQNITGEVDSFSSLFTPGWDKRDGDNLIFKRRYQF